MRVFITGGTGFIGTAVVNKLLTSGHQVLGLARTDGSANALKAAGADVIRGTVTNLEVLKNGAFSSDGVIHLAFDNDFSRYAEANAEDLEAVQAIGSALEGTDKPFVVTSGTAAFSVLGRVATEHDALPSDIPRMAAENAVIAMAEKGVRASAVRLAACVHDKVQFGLATYLIGLAREKNISAYLNDGANVWPAVHRQDAADLYVRALESASAGTRLHAVSEEGVSIKTIAETIGRGLNIPVVSLAEQEAKKHFGFVFNMVSINNPASGELTKELINWQPNQTISLIEDLENHLAQE